MERLTSIKPVLGHPVGGYENEQALFAKLKARQDRDRGRRGRARAALTAALAWFTLRKANRPRG